MSTTSSSHADRPRTVLLMAILGVMITGCASAVPPDAPRLVAAAEPAPSPPAALDDSAYRGPLDITSVRVRRLDAALERLAGSTFMKAAADPLAIEVVTAKPLPSVPRTTSAVIILNGETFADTWTILPNRLIAFIPDRNRIRETNSVAAAWLGAEAASISRQALTFRAQDVGK